MTMAGVCQSVVTEPGRQTVLRLGSTRAVLAMAPGSRTPRSAVTVDANVAHGSTINRMRLIQFGHGRARDITAPGSTGLAGVPLVHPDGQCGLIVMYLEAGGEIGRHRATWDQLLLVVSGSGTVCGDDGRWHPITAGEAVYFTAGEEHTTRASSAMMVIINEGPHLPLTR